MESKIRQYAEGCIIGCILIFSITISQNPIAKMLSPLFLLKTVTVWLYVRSNLHKKKPTPVGGG